MTLTCCSQVRASSVSRSQFGETLLEFSKGGQSSTICLHRIHKKGWHDMLPVQHHIISNVAMAGY
jgi:hypothetical protein